MHSMMKIKFLRFSFANYIVNRYTYNRYTYKIGKVNILIKLDHCIYL